MDINFVAIKGRMTRDARIIESQTGKLLLLKLATNHGQGENRKPTYHSAMYYPQSDAEGQFLLDNLRSGITAHVTGALGNYKDCNGTETTFIRAQTVQVLSFPETTQAKPKVDDEEAALARAIADFDEPAPASQERQRREPVRQASVATGQAPAAAVSVPMTLKREASAEVQF